MTTSFEKRELKRFLLRYQKRVDVANALRIWPNQVSRLLEKYPDLKPEAKWLQRGKNV